MHRRLRLLIYILVASATLFLLLYTRFININWSQGYPFHPDERNMADAVTRLQCDLPHGATLLESLKTCFNPKFFAYGQLPLYLAYGLVIISKMASGAPVGAQFGDAILALRVISATASVVTVIFAIRILKLFIPRAHYVLIYALPLIFSPALIQFAHFGTTESLLMMFYMILVYLAIAPHRSWGGLLWMGVVTGVAVGVKSSAALFATLALVNIWAGTKHTLRYRLLTIFGVSCAALIVYILTSPHNLISWSEFVGSMRYESDVVWGSARVFYTRTFAGTVPYVFQFVRIFPYALGYPIFLLFLCGFVFLPWTKKYNLLRLAYLAYFIPMGLFYTKWTRFMAPVFPLMVIIACLMLERMRIVFSNLTIDNIRLKNKTEKSKNVQNNFYIFLCRFSFLVFIFALILPGVAFLSIYTHEDVRFQASRWMANNVKNDSVVLQETANVVDLPIFPPSYQLAIPRVQNISFNYYDLDQNTTLQKDLIAHLEKADYIVIPSRRIYANHTCLHPEEVIVFKNRDRCLVLEQKYPRLNQFYSKLFNGELGYQQVARFSSYPQLEVGGRVIVEAPDEGAEETWTVFDHPVIRIYKKTK